MPDAARAVSGIPRADPGGRVTPRFWHRLNRFRHFCGGSLALASLDRACRNLVPAFPQRSPRRLLTAAACGGLRSAPDCRTRRALLHLSYSCAPPILMTALVTHDPKRSFGAGGPPAAIRCCPSGLWIGNAGRYSRLGSPCGSDHNAWVSCTGSISEPRRFWPQTAARSTRCVDRAAPKRRVGGATMQEGTSAAYTTGSR
jgi:hypothetical protein